MKTQKITQAEFDKLQKENGIKVCPGFTDYSAIDAFDEPCRFGDGCRFGTAKKFAPKCHFGDWCVFDEQCHFGDGTFFGNFCRFNNFCVFGKHCTFGEQCRFGTAPDFVAQCTFGDGCRFENAAGYAIGRTPYLSAEGFGQKLSTHLYLFILDTGLWVRVGKFWGTPQQFLERQGGDPFYKEALRALVKKAASLV